MVYTYAVHVGVFIHASMKYMYIIIAFLYAVTIHIFTHINENAAVSMHM